MRFAPAALAAAALFAAAAAFAQPAATDEPVYVHIAVQGDTLIGLGRRFLTEPRRWPEVQRANDIRNPNRIPVGSEVRIPLRLMRTEAASGSVLHVVGEVRSGGAAVQPGQPIGEGNELSTAADSHATVRLVDGTVLRLRPSSQLSLRESRRIKDAGATQSGARLEKGRVEVEAAPASAGKPGFRIETPQGVLGVRGTEFRVAIDEAERVTRGEVLEGVVAFEGASRGTAAAPVGAGFGSVIGGTGQVATPVKLLDKPDTAPLPTLQERILMRFPLAPLPGATAYRGQISRDRSFDQVVADLTSPTPELRFAELPDGDYILRVRGIGQLGLEGQNADLAFKLKARPEPPLPSAPAPKAVIFGGKVEFAWTANAQAATYRLQIDGANLATPFKGPAPLVRELKDLRETVAVVEGLNPGAYLWRLQSVRADGDQGPWGDARAFEIRPLPPKPAPPKVSDRGVSFAWDALPGQTFEFQVARDAEFKNLVLERQLTEPKFEFTPQGTGRFYVRLRARDPDGFIGPYSSAQSFEMPNCLRDSSGNCVRGSNEMPLQLTD